MIMELEEVAETMTDETPEKSSTDIGLDTILKAEDLRSLNDLLTRSMAKQQIQILIRGDGLRQISAAIEDLAAAAPPQDEIVAAAMLGRLAAVARGREAEVVAFVANLFSEEPPSIETLADGDEKSYAAHALGHAEGDWVLRYCLREAVLVDTADIARRELLRIALSQIGTVSKWIGALMEHADIVRGIESPEVRLRRSRRIFGAMLEVLRSYDGEVGSQPGAALASIFGAFTKGALGSAGNDIVLPLLDNVVGMVARVVELRFSYALQSETYSILIDGKKLLMQGPWARFVEKSTSIGKVRISLLEAALVLARQNRTDREILRAMQAAWPSTSQVSAAVKSHFAEAQDLDAQVADYWLKVGVVSQSERQAEHRFGNTEDQQIGELLIQLQANRETMAKLHSAAVPVLRTFDPCQAATVERAASGYEVLAQIAERLARMRKLSKTEMKGQRVEYNPMVHDMDGGHRLGIRTVKVVRDGIQKEFGGKKKMLVKPRVEPVE